MKKTALGVALVLMALHCGMAHAGKKADDLSLWGNTGAKPEPKTDSKGRAGCWWLPVEAAKNDHDGELWGNRGVVFRAWKKLAMEKKPAPPKSVPGPIMDGTGGVPRLNDILFDFGKAVLKTEGKVEADKLVADLKKYGRDTVIIEGHASSEGDEVYNNALGLRRAEAVKKYMVESGIAPERITTVSFGETKPAVPNDVKANRKLNRRVQFKLNLVN